MYTINVYTSNPANLELVGFALALEHNLCRPVQLLPLSQLPRPDTQRRQALRLERTELEEAIWLAQLELSALTNGTMQPDAGRENGLRFDLEALTNRLRGVETVLNTEKGGRDNA